MVAPTLKNMILCRGELHSPVFVIGNRLFSGRRGRRPLRGIKHIPRSNFLKKEETVRASD